MELWESLSRMIASLAVVLGLMMGLLYLVRRVMAAKGIIASNRPLVQVVATGYIGPKKAISLVSVAGELLIVGVTANDLVPLGRIADPERIRSRAQAKVEAEVQQQAQVEVKGEMRK